MTGRSTVAAGIDRSIAAAAEIGHSTAMIGRSPGCTGRTAGTAAAAGHNPGCTATVAGIGSGCWLCGSLRPSCSQPC